jgi:protein-disulfide isomerase
MTGEEKEKITADMDRHHPITVDEEVEITTVESNQPVTSGELFVISRTALNYFIIAVIAFALGIGITLIATSSLAAQNRQLIEQAVAAALEAWGETGGQQADAPDPNRVEVSVGDDPALGPEDAPVVMIEFSDFNCPYCGRFAHETLPLLRENYADQVRFVYRDFPILGESSLQAAIAAECAYAQGAFWEYHDVLFENQGNFSQPMLIRFAEELGLDVVQFTACQRDEATRDAVIADYAEAQRLGVTGTPTFFINGRRMVGAQPYEVFQRMIDEELASVEAVPASGVP